MFSSSGFAAIAVKFVPLSALGRADTHNEPPRMPRRLGPEPTMARAHTLRGHPRFFSLFSALIAAEPNLWRQTD
jgi:hypothetical protein